MPIKDDLQRNYVCLEKKEDPCGASEWATNDSAMVSVNKLQG